MHGQGEQGTVHGDDDVELKTGTWQYGQMEGPGTWFYSTHSFEGEFRQNNFFKGKLTYPDGNYSIGTFENNREEGKGSFFIKKSGDEIFCETWKKGRIDG